MMENIYRNDSDPLEGNIRRSIHEWEEAPPAEWDTPPPALWDKIAAATPPPPAATGIIWWKWLSGALIVVGLTTGSLWWVNKQPSAPEKPTSAAAQTPVMAEQTAPQTEYLRPESGQQPLPETAAASTPPSGTSQEIASLPNISSAAPARKTTSASSDAREGLSLTGSYSPKDLDANTNAPRQNQTAIAELPAPVAEPPLPAAPSETPSIAEMPVAESPALALWSPTALLESAAPESLPIPERIVSPLEPAIKRAPKTGHFFAGAYLAPNQTFRQIQSDRPVAQLPAFLRENESASWTTEHGLRVGWQPNRRIALSVGIGQYNVSLQSRHRFRIPFDPGRERPVNNNNFESNYSLSVPSSYGDANVEVGVQRPGNQPLMPGQFLTVNTLTKTELRYISVPITATCFLHTTPRLSIGIKGGVALSILDSQNFTATSTIGLRGLRSRTITVQRQAPDIDKTMTDYHLGAALWYRPAPGWTVIAEPSYRHSIGTVLDRNDYSVSQYSWGVQLGVQKSF